MNSLVWIIQILLAGLYLYSGTCKSLLSQQALVAVGQTGAEAVSMRVTRFIGVIEILGAAGLILPMALNVMPKLTPLSAVGFSIIMILAARLHYHRHETKNVVFNILLFFLCALVAWYRF